MAAAGSSMPVGSLLICAIGYLGFSLLMSLFNSWLLNKQRFNFPFPLLAATLYDVVQFALAAAVLRWQGGPECSPWKMLRRLRRAQLLGAILPCAMAGGLDIALSNYALRHVSLAFYTMVKSSSPLFVLLFAFALGIERPSWRLAGIMAVIATGTLLTVWNEFQFNLLGFGLLFGASLMSGVRWALTQLIIREQQGGADEEEENLGHLTKGPMATIFYLAPCVGLCLGTLAAALEGPRLGPVVRMYWWTLPGIALAGGLISFGLILVEYRVVEGSSVITFSIMGIFKELVIIGASILLLGEHLTRINWLGAAISILGILLYQAYRNRSKRHRHPRTESQAELMREQQTTANAFFLVVPASEPMPLFNPFFDSSSSDEDDDHVEGNDEHGRLAESKSLCIMNDEDAIHLHHSCSALSAGLADLTNPQPIPGAEPSLMQSNVSSLLSSKRRHHQLHSTSAAPCRPLGFEDEARD